MRLLISLEFQFHNNVKDFLFDGWYNEIKNKIDGLSYEQGHF